MRSLRADASAGVVPNAGRTSRRPSRRRPRLLTLPLLALSLAAGPLAAVPEPSGGAGTDAPPTSRPRAALGSHPEPYLVRDLGPGPDGLGPSGLRSFGDRVLGYNFEVVGKPSPGVLDWLYRSDVLVSDGSEAGTLPLLPDGVTFAWWMSEPGSDRLQFFAACEAPVSVLWGCSQRELDLWRTDGTPEGTFPLTEGGALDTSSAALFDGLYLEERGLMFFRGAEPTDGADRGFELWVTDGREAGTRLLADLAPEGSGFPGHMVELDSRLYFTFSVGSGEASRRFVGRSDGTPEGTRVRPGGPADPRARPIDLWAGDDEVFGFYLVHAEEMSLWRDDGGAEGLKLLAEDLGGLTPLDLRFVAQAEDKLFFLTSTPFNRRDTELWASDGTPGGTRRIPRPPGTVLRDSFSYQAYRVVGDRFYFLIDDGVHGREPWVSDGTIEGTRMIRDFCPGPCDSSRFFPVRAWGDRVLVVVRTDDGLTRLLIYEPETGALQDLTAACPDGCNLGFHLADAGDLTYFTLHDGVHDREVWVSDGTVAGTRRLSDFQADDPFFQPFYARPTLRPPAAVAGGRLFFGAEDAEHGWELWAVELPEEGTAFPMRPAGDPLTTPELPGFAAWVRITPGAGEPIPGRAEARCIPETLCVSGAVPGRSEVFARIVGPKPNGFLWPTLVKFTTSTVEVWLEQLSSGVVRYYRLEGASPGTSELPGMFDREGFLPYSSLRNDLHVNPFARPNCPDRDILRDFQIGDGSVQVPVEKPPEPGRHLLPLVLTRSDEV